ncbi:MAG: DUF262 domain-containing HNH endonuclease family protein [Oscillospiraceae bacterium]|jgi:uncharacterized protein with ParB-like and HNH nuclease domain|nr:DUF262 domain-containing HNH endonuclease family protein [Oscillospiraceae bacterium]
MKAMEVNFREFITAGRRTFTIPVYQRNYEWKEQECSKLFNDIEAIAHGNVSHFVGTIVYVTSANSNATWNEFTIIDGQQRITTVMLLLKAIHDLTKNEDVKDEIWNDYLTNKRAREEKYRLKLKPIESDATTWVSLIDGQTPSNISSNLWKNYEIFKHKVADSQFSPQELFEAIGKLEIVYIQLDTGKENPQVIFESINSTGLNLTQGDLIRNFLLMNCDSQEKQTRLYKNYWIRIEEFLTPQVIPDFIRDYLTMKNGAIVKIGNVYEAFKQYAHANFLGREEDLLAELKRYAEYYSWCRFNKSDSKELNSLLIQFHEIKSFVAFELLLWFFDKCYNLRVLSEEGLFNCIRTLLSYQYRRLVCKAQYNFSLSTNALNTTYAALPREIGDADNIPDKLLKILAGKVRSQTFPRDDVFKSAFQTFDLYSAKLAKYTLEMVENTLNPKERVALTEEITIEHIMPQTLNATWRGELGKDYEQVHSQWQHTIGNLTLSGYNSRLSNESFTDKKATYLSSNIALSRDAATADSWDVKSIQNRAARLSEKALEIWTFPEKYSITSSDSEIDYSASYNIMDNIKVTGQTPRSYIFGVDEYLVDSWKSLFLGILNRLFEFDGATFEKLIVHETFKKRHLAEPADSGYCYRSKSPNEICPGYYAETGHSAQDLMSFTQIAVELFGLEDDVEFTFKRCTPRQARTITIQTNTSTEQDFKNWLVASDKAENTANQYATILRGTLVSTLNAQSIANTNLFDYTSSEDFERVNNQIIALPNYNATNEYKHHSFSAAQTAYAEFLRSEIVNE